MLRGAFIIIVAIATKYYLKRELYKHNYIGCFLTILGVVLVGVANFAFAEPSDHEVNYIENNYYLSHSFKY